MLKFIFLTPHTEKKLYFQMSNKGKALVFCILANIYFQIIEMEEKYSL